MLTLFFLRCTLFELKEQSKRHYERGKCMFEFFRYFYPLLMHCFLCLPLPRAYLAASLLIYFFCCIGIRGHVKAWGGINQLYKHGSWTSTSVHFLKKVSSTNAARHHQAIQRRLFQLMIITILKWHCLIRSNLFANNDDNYKKNFDRMLFKLENFSLFLSFMIYFWLSCFNVLKKLKRKKIFIFLLLFTVNLYCQCGALF